MSTREESERDSWRVQLFGQLKVTLGRETIDQFRTRKTASLLAYLAFHRSPTPREVLIELLWPDVPHRNGQNNLRVLLSHLRAQSELHNPTSSVISSQFIHANRVTVALHPTVTTDVEAFESELRLASKLLDARERVQAYERAIGFYAGPLLPGFYESWIPLEATRLEAAYIRALHLVADFYREEDPSRAQEYKYLAHRSQVASFDAPAPLSVTRRSRISSIEAQKTTSQPSQKQQRTDEIHESSLVASALKLPVPLTRCFGREAEIIRLFQHLCENQTRLVTLTGPGGVGKTRLALEVAHHLRANQCHLHQDKVPKRSELTGCRVLWLPLADVTEPERLPEVLMTKLNLPSNDGENTQPLERICQALTEEANKDHLLLLFDNVEHLLPEAASLVHLLLERVPQLRILATSRRCMNVLGECEIAVSPLDVPPNIETLASNDLNLVSGSSSFQLLVDRLSLARSDWSFLARDLPALTALVRKLEGLPLAIELVAARGGVLSARQMVARLDDSLDWVSSRKSGLPLRHRSLRAAFEWSVGLLASNEKGVLAQLSVFRGGWTFEDACSVVTDVTSNQMLDVLQELRDASLIFSLEEEGGELRFSMLEVIRQNAGELLLEEEAEAIKGRHALHYFNLAMQASTQGDTVTKRKLSLNAEHSNFSAALEFWMRANLERALQMVESLWWMWIYTSEFAEGRRWFQRLLDHPDVADFPLAQARAQSGAAFLALSDDDTEGAEPLLLAASTYWQKRIESGDNSVQGDLASTFNLLGSLFRVRNEPLRACEFYRQSLAIRRQQNNLRELVVALNALATAEREAHNADEVRRLCREVISMKGNGADEGAISWALQTLGWLSLDENDFAAARALLEESLSLRRQNRLLPRIADSLEALAEVALRENAKNRAYEHFEEALHVWRALHRRNRVRELQQKIADLRASS